MKTWNTSKILIYGLVLVIVLIGIILFPKSCNEDNLNPTQCDCYGIVFPSGSEGAKKCVGFQMLTFDGNRPIR